MKRTKESLLEALTEIKRLKNVCTMKNVDIEMAIEELQRIKNLTSNCVTEYTETIISNLKRATEYERL